MANSSTTVNDVTLNTITFINKGDDGYESVPINATNLNLLQTNVQTSLDDIVTNTNSAFDDINTNITEISSNLGNLSELSYEVISEIEEE